MLKQGYRVDDEYVVELSFFDAEFYIDLTELDEASALVTVQAKESPTLVPIASFSLPLGTNPRELDLVPAVRSIVSSEPYLALSHATRQVCDAQFFQFGARDDASIERACSTWQQ